MPAKKLKEFLDRNQIKYVSIHHSTAYTSQEIAALTHIPGKELAKTVMVKLDGKLAMAVIPASHMVDFNALKNAADAGSAQLATESEFKSLFPDCETGAMPPFGNLYGMTVYASLAMAQDEQITFNAGTHHELIRLAYKDFERLTQPVVAGFSKVARGVAA
ncbi:MAG: YbaK/EbsC family protein [Acidobacteria bacterium]|nr:YbaK/EbsC family protein [Acidobacteriota bacterium]